MENKLMFAPKVPRKIKRVNGVLKRSIPFRYGAVTIHVFRKPGVSVIHFIRGVRITNEV